MSDSAKIGQRGPVDHERREQIVRAARDHFRQYGYNKTTVADLAKAIGLSTAYIYKFFESKKAIGKSACSICLAEISNSVEKIANEDRPASDQLRRMAVEMARGGERLFFNNRNMHEIVAAAIEENWHSCAVHEKNLSNIISKVIQDGRDAGEFERKTPLSEVCHAVLMAMEAVRHPVLLKQRLNTLEDDAICLANLMLRSLAP